MKERRKSELALICGQHKDVDVSPEMDWFIIKAWPLTGWSMDHTPVLVLIPPGYPTTPPDNFFTDPGLRIRGGAQPGSTSEQTQLNRKWLQFSYHVEEWSPNAEPLQGHNLLTFLEGVRRRLSEAN